MLTCARAIAAESDRLDDEVAQLRGEQAGSIHVYVSPLAAVKIMPQALARFRAKFPKIEIHLTSGLFPTALKPVRDGRTNTTMDSLNNAKQLKIVTDMIAQARALGQDLQELGQVPDEALYNGGGYFQKPTLVFNADPKLDVVRQDQFSPALPIIPFEDEADAIAMANDDPFGLASSISTEDRDHAVALARQIEAGYTFFNAIGPSAQGGDGPFGGFKKSGIGRNFGYEGMMQFQGYHSISGAPGSLIT